VRHALIVVDVQRDFCEGGALAASDTLSLLDPLSRFVDAARRAGAQIVFTQDWHPANHSSFQTQGGPWPIHCVADSSGAQLMPPLAAEPGDLVIHKGVSVAGAGYSGFESTELLGSLRALAVAEIAVCGIATEYCVRATALDAVNSGLQVTVLHDLVRPVQAPAVAEALQEFVARGIAYRDSSDWVQSLGKSF
jgi:nicotinamidase/pyrazinamidase